MLTGEIFFFQAEDGIRGYKVTGVQRVLYRSRCSGQPEFVETFFEYIAEEVRELLATLGFRTMAEAIGHGEAIDTRSAVDHWKASGLDLTPILPQPPSPFAQDLHSPEPKTVAAGNVVDPGCRPSTT